MGNSNPEKGGAPDYAYEAPSASELALLYAAISEPAEYKNIKEEFGADDTDKEKIVFVTCRANTELVGVLRGRKTDDQNGIVHNVVVRGDYRNKGIARELVEKLKAGYPAQWIGYPYRVAPKLDRDLNIVRALYGISLTLAFQEMVRATYRLIAHRWHDYPAGVDLLLLALAFGLSMVGCRFFFAAGNIRRYYLRHIAKLEKIPEVHTIVMVHLPVLFAHAVLYFFLCESFSDLVNSGTNPGTSLFFAIVVTTLLWLNAIWLLCLKVRGISPDGLVWPEDTWILNNAICGLAGLASALLFAQCREHGVISLLLITVVIITNSVIDLWYVSNAYLLGDAMSGG